MIAIIDYGAGNIRSVEKALMHIGCEVEVTQDPSILMKADGAVLPGVGSFGDAMHELRGRELEAPIKAFVASGKPFLGICLGLQILFESSEESPGVSGLSLLKGKVLRIPAAPGGIRLKSKRTAGCSEALRASRMCTLCTRII